MQFSNKFINFFTQIYNSHQQNKIAFLKVETQILRSKCPYRRMVLTDKERNRLIKFGQPLGGDIKRIITIVSPSAFYSWIRKQRNPDYIPQRRGRSRKFTIAIKELIVEMAKRNKWGYTRIIGELKKLDIIKSSKTSIKNVLIEYGIDPLSIRSEDTWDQFLKRTFQTLWACDYFAKTVWTPFGRKIFYCLFFINIKTRKVHIAGITTHPNNEWTLTQIEKLHMTFNEELFGKAVLIRDRDNKFSHEFDQFFKDLNIDVLKIPFRSPNMNPYAESWVATIKRECLNHFFILGKIHLEHLIYEFVNYYNHHRPHSSMNQAICFSLSS
ncbi:MAG: integrase core domain-containing protein [Candidatus Omnitrophica bacterium]|nr:integrase core domain-containing protein [Candidatus Omnitrophota bacterium]